MEKVDVRLLSPKAQERFRQLAVKAVLDGRKQVDVAKLYCVTRRAISNWLKAYRNAGFQALRAKPKGRPKGDRYYLGRRLKLQKRWWTITRNNSSCPFTFGPEKQWQS